LPSVRCGVNIPAAVEATLTDKEISLSLSVAQRPPHQLLTGEGTSRSLAKLTKRRVRLNQTSAYPQQQPIKQGSAKPVSALSNPVSAREIRILKIRDWRLTPQIGGFSPDAYGLRASETYDGAARRRNCRAFSRKAEMTGRDRTGWLGREDSNLRMAESKVPETSELKLAPVEGFIRHETKSSGQRPRMPNPSLIEVVDRTRL
jgi:hypothetical protein